VDLENFWIELLLPFPLGDDVLTSHLHLKNVWETAGYPGSPALVFAATILFRAMWPVRQGLDRVRQRTAAAILLLGLYLCYGGWLPGFASFREPLKARALVALGIALAAALATQELMVWASSRGTVQNVGSWLSKPNDARWRLFDRYLMVWVCWAFVLAAGWAWIAVGLNADAVGRWLLRFGPPIDSLRAADWQVALANPRILSQSVQMSLAQVLCCLLGAATVLSALALRPSRSLFWAAIALAVIEPYAVHYRTYVSRHPFQAVALPGGFQRAIREEIERTRRARRPPWRVSLPPCLANRGHLVDGLWETGGYDPIMPWGANNRIMIMPLAAGRNGATTRPLERDIARAVGRRYDFTHWDPYDDLRRGLADAPFDLSVYEVAPEASLFTLETHVRCGTPPGYTFGPTLDGVHFVTEKPRFEPQAGTPEEPAEFQRKVAATGLTPLGSSGNSAQLLPDYHEGPSTIYPLVALSPHEYAYVVRTSTPALALLRMTWLPGWRARVDDHEWGRPWCANGWMLAVPLPAGVHKVEFIYRPVGWDAARVVALLTSIGILALVGSCARRTRFHGFRQ
jgi:hypothetical protein